MAIDSPDISEFYAFYEASVLPVIKKCDEERKLSAKSSLKVYGAIVAVCVVTCLYLRDFLPIIPALFIMIFFFLKERRRLEKFRSDEVISTALRYVDVGLSYRSGSDERSQGVKKAGFYASSNDEDAACSVSGGVSGILFSISFVEVRKIIGLAINNIVIGGVITVLLTVIFAKFFSLIFTGDQYGSFFGAGVGLFAAYCYLSEFNRIIFKKKDLFRGVLISADFNRKFYGRTYVCSKFSGSEADIQGKRALRELTSNNADFSHEFTVYSSSQKDVEDILTDDMVLAMLSIKKHFEGAVDFSFRDSYVYVIVRKNYFPNINIFSDSDPFGNIALFYKEIRDTVDIFKASGMKELLAKK